MSRVVWLPSATRIRSTAGPLIKFSPTSKPEFKEVAHLLSQIKRSAVLICILLLSLVGGPAQAQRDPCRDELGNEICPHFNAGDGRVNPFDPVATTTAYCQSDKALHVYSILNSVGEFLFRATEGEISSALSNATRTGRIVLIGDVRGHQLVALPSGSLRIQDATGFNYTFPGSICGGPAFAPNPNPLPVIAPPAATPATAPATLAAKKVIPATSYTVITQAQGRLTIVVPGGFNESTITTGRVNLRSRPLIAADTLLITIPAGTSVQVLGRDDTASWLLVIYDGSYGWIASQYTAYTEATIARVPVVTFG